MKTLIKIIAVTVVACFAPVERAKAEASVSIDFFYESLEPHGSWMEVSDYGYVWQPRSVAEDWRPYTVGNWAYTEAGWTWVSEEPHGWATYHYGRWIKLADAGWVWVPDTTWGPAWVSWRKSDRHIGWAPLPPEAQFRRTVGIQAWSDSYYDIGPENYSFVEVRNLGAPRLATVVLPPRENVTVIRETRNITKITYRNTYVYNEGPEYDVVVRASAQPIRRLKLTVRDDVDYRGDRRREDIYRSRVEGDALRIVAPRVDYRQDLAPRNISRRIERAEVRRGWETVNNADQIRAQIRENAPELPAELPRQPRFDRARLARGEDADDAGAAGREGARQAAGEMRRDAAPAAQPTVGTPGATDANTPENARRSAAERAADREERARAGASGRGENREATSPSLSTSPGAATAPSDQPRSGEMNNRRERDNRAGAEGQQPRTEAAPGAANPAGAEAAADRERRRGGDGAARRDRAATDANPNAAGEQNAGQRRDEQKMRERGNIAGDQPEARTTPNESPAREGADRQSPANRGEQPDRPNRGAGNTGQPEARATAPERPDRPARPDRPEGAARRERPAGADGPETSNVRTPSNTAPDRPERPERPQQPDRPQRAEQPDRPTPREASPAARTERLNPSRAAREARPEAAGRPQGGGGGRPDAGPAARGGGGGDRPGGGGGPAARAGGGGGAGGGDASPGRGAGGGGGGGGDKKD